MQVQIDPYFHVRLLPDPEVTYMAWLCSRFSPFENFGKDIFKFCISVYCDIICLSVLYANGGRVTLPVLFNLILKFFYPSVYQRFSLNPQCTL